VVAATVVAPGELSGREASLVAVVVAVAVAAVAAAVTAGSVATNWKNRLGALKEVMASAAAAAVAAESSETVLAGSDLAIETVESGSLEEQEAELDVAAFAVA